MRHRAPTAPVSKSRHGNFGDRLDAIGWGLLLIMTGVIWLSPEEQIPRGTWLIGTGVLLLSLNAVRHAYGIGVRAFTVFLGALTLAAGLGDYLGVDLPLMAISLIVIGAAILLKPLVGRPG